MTAKTTIFSMIRDINGYNGFGLMQSTSIVDTTLIADVAQSTTVPSDYEYYLAIFSYERGTTVFVSNTGVADLPGVAFSSSDSFMSPPAWLVKKGSSLSFITPDTEAFVSVSYYAIPSFGSATI